jgi:hypothetical protein
MSNLAKYVVAPILIVSVIVTVAMWVTPGVAGLGEQANRRIRLASTATTVVAVCVVIWSICRKDLVPDYLRANVHHCFERHGFCFSLAPRTDEGVFALVVLFQNRYSRSCTAKIVLAPAHLPGLESALVIPVECAEAGFGMTRLPLPIPQAGQGQTHKFRVYADVAYPEGRGRMLRFKEGAAVGGTKADRNNLLLGLALLPFGVAYSTIPASVAIEVPTGVADTLPPNEHPTAQIFWQLGQPLEDVQVAV